MDPRAMLLLLHLIELLALERKEKDPEIFRGGIAFLCILTTNNLGGGYPMNPAEIVFSMHLSSDCWCYTCDMFCDHPPAAPPSPLTHTNLTGIHNSTKIMQLCWFLHFRKNPREIHPIWLNDLLHLTYTIIKLVAKHPPQRPILVRWFHDIQGSNAVPLILLEVGHP